MVCQYKIAIYVLEIYICTLFLSQMECGLFLYIEGEKKKINDKLNAIKL